MAIEKVRWLAWGDEALARAQDEDKQILLDLDATWCHWCHVMENTTYSDPAVIKVVNEHFVPVRVDPDRRPDINERYNQGGWPTTAFLSPSGEVLFGATYVPPDQMQNILRKILELWQTKRSEVRSAIDSFRENIRAQRELATREPVSGAIPDDALEQSADKLSETFDYAHGGFGSAQAGFAPKFPFPDATDVCLLHYSLTGDSEALVMAKRTLDGMMTLHDWEEGGFYRYGVNRDWTVPHYEKMLETNAALIRSYLHGWHTLKEPRYRDTVSGVLQWATTTMSDPNGGFYGSQDADGEDAYYGLSLEERAKLPKPSVDHTIFCDWSAQMARSFLDSFIMFGEVDLLSRGLYAIDWLLENCRMPNGLMYHHWSDNEPHVPGMLRDQAQMILALSRAYQVSSYPHYLQAAIEIIEKVLSEYQDEEVGGFFDIMSSEEIEQLEFRQRKNIIDNATIVHGLLEIADITSRLHYRYAAERAMRLFDNEYTAFLPLAANYSLAAWRLTEPQNTVVVVGRSEDPQASRLLMEALAAGYPFSIAYQLDPEKDQERLSELGFPEDEKAIAYVCQQTSCRAVAEPEKLAMAVQHKST